ncbi:OsmC family protein [Modicisalibacter zincidurans]|uniref:OsmC family peroxiredoxin n=1 Tax=Modicisalibacter zincidurans TaxID=1178777 RepID=A0ABP9RIT3_9GAMM|nr:OsmC family protein [Halomonas zincidurans]|tara:strand:+ start:272 stop:694 length:423 start_codon:yes stop_codon:yes gene_type:complete
MTITVISSDGHSLRQRVELEHFDDLFVDAPAIVGGDESAPDPHDYFDLALGACKAITARMYARRKQWPLSGVTVTVTRNDREERQGRYYLYVSLAFAGIDDPDQLQRLLEIADRCPIHRLITDSTVEIRSRLASDQGPSA